MLCEFVEHAVEVLVVLALQIDLLDGVQDGGVVLAAELAADLGQRGLGEVLAEIHGDLAREDDLARVVLGLDLLRGAGRTAR